MDSSAENQKPDVPSAAIPEDEPTLVSGSLWHTIWLMSWPLLLTTVAASLVGVADVQVAGYLGSQVQAAVGLSEHIIFMFSIVPLSFGAGTTAIVSRTFGARDREATLDATAQSIIFAVFSGTALALLALFTARFILPLFSHSKEVLAYGDLYLSFYGIYLIPFSIICIANAAMRATGDARTPLLIVAVEVIINIAGDYLTVLGNWPVPGLGVRGIAAAAVVGALVGSALSIYFLARSPLGDFKSRLKIDWAMQWRITRIGVPTALQRTSWAASVLVMFFILKLLPDPTAALASWTIAMRIEALVFMPLMALSIAAANIVGQNLGAQKQERAVAAGWHITWIGVGTMIVFAGGLLLFTPELARLMSKDPATIAITIDYLRINLPSEPVLAITMILGGALQGAGDTKSQMWMSVFTNWFIRLPLAYFLAVTMKIGPNGIWIAMVCSITVFAAIISFYYKKGKWLRTQV